MDEMLFNWLVLISGYSDQNVIREEQRPADNGKTGPQPVGDFITWQTISGPDFVSEYDNYTRTAIDAATVEKTFKHDYFMTVSVKVYAEDGDQLIKKLAMSAGFQSVRAALGENVKIVGLISARDLPVYQDTHHKQVYIGDFRFRVCDTIAETYERVNSVDAGAELVPLDPYRILAETP